MTDAENERPTPGSAGLRRTHCSLVQQFEHRSNGALYFLVRIKRNLVVVKNQTHWQREVQFTLVRLRCQASLTLSSWGGLTAYVRKTTRINEVTRAPGQAADQFSK